MDMAEQLQQWQYLYNWDRAHGYLQRNTSMQRFLELADQTPVREEVEARTTPEKRILAIRITGSIEN